MATYASRPAWGLRRTRAIASTWVAVPVGPRGARRRLAAAADDRARDRLLDRRGPVGRDRGPPAGRHPGRAAQGRLAAALLHAAALLARHRGQLARRGCARSACSSRCSRSRSAGGREGRLGHGQGGLVRGHPDGLQPVPGAVRPGGADVLDGRAAGDPGDGLLPARLRAGHAEPPAVDRGLRALGGGRALHAQLADLLPRRGRASAWVVLWWIATGRAAGSCSATPCWASAAPSSCTCRGCRRRSTRPPTPAPRGPTRPPSARCSACRGPARPDAGDRALDLRRRGTGHASPTGRWRARPRRRVRCDHRRADADDRLDALAGLTRLGQPLPRGRAAAVPAARRGRPSNARRLGFVGLVLVVVMWAQDAAPVEKSNVRAIAHAIGPSLAAGRPGDLDAAGDVPVTHYYLPTACATRR